MQLCKTESKVQVSQIVIEIQCLRKNSVTQLGTNTMELFLSCVLSSQRTESPD